MAERRSSLRRVLLGGLLLAAGAGLGYFFAGQRDTRPAGLGARQTLADTATVLVAVRGLARLESVAFHMERVIDLKERQDRLFGLFHADDAILLVASGDVIAGVDLAKMRDGDVVIEPDRRGVRLQLPAPEILSVSIDNQRTYVHSRKTDLFAQPGTEMETQARRLAEDSIRDAALQAGILARARQNAETTLTTLIRSLGFDQIEIIDVSE